MLQLVRLRVNLSSTWEMLFLCWAQELSLHAGAGPARRFRSGRGLLLPGVSVHCLVVHPGFVMRIGDGMLHFALVCSRFIEWDAAPAVFEDAINLNIPLSGVRSSAGSGFVDSTDALFCRACAPSATTKPASLAQFRCRLRP